MLSDIHKEGQVMNEEHYLRDLRRVAGVVGTVKDTRTLERKLKEGLKMDAKVPVMDRVYDTYERFEAHVRQNQWKRSYGLETYGDSQLAGR